MVQRRARQRVVFAEHCERVVDVVRAEAEVPERNEEIGMPVDDVGAPDVAVRSALCVLELDHANVVRLGSELAVVNGSMMRAAQDDEVVRVVSSAFGAVLEVWRSTKVALR